MATAGSIPSSDPIIVVVHGAWHTPTHYNALVSGLKALGHTILIPELPSMNQARPPNADLYTDTDHIRRYVENLADAGHAIIVLMHSYGGQVGTNALAGLDLNSRREANILGGVVRLVYMSAHAQSEGVSMYGIVKAAGREQFLLDALLIEDDGTVEYRDTRGRMIGSGLSEPELEEYVAGLRPWNGKPMYQEIRAAAWRDLPVSYILTLQDRVVPLAYQTTMVERLRAAGCEVETFELDTGHCAHVTMAKEVVEILVTILSREAR